MSPTPDPQALATEALAANWDHLSAVHASPLRVNTPRTQQDRDIEQMNTHPNRPMVASPGMVHGPLGTLHGPPSPPSAVELPAEAGRQPAAPPRVVNSKTLQALLVSSDNYPRKDIRSRLPPTVYDQRLPTPSGQSSAAVWCKGRLIGTSHYSCSRGLPLSHEREEPFFDH